MSRNPGFLRLLPYFPTIKTSEVSNITETGMTCGGEVSDYPATSRGVCWSTTTNPTTANTYTIDGSGLGVFTSTLTGLTTNTIYYIRAWAANEKGLVYGDNVTGKTLNGWNLVDVGEDVNYVTQYYTAGKMFVQSANAIYISSNLGSSWTSTGITATSSLKGNVMTASAANLFVSTVKSSDGRLYKYDNSTWSQDQPAGDTSKSWGSYSVRGFQYRIASEGTKIYTYYSGSWHESSRTGHPATIVATNNSSMGYATRFNNGLVAGTLYSIEMPIDSVTEIKTTGDVSKPYSALFAGPGGLVLVAEQVGRLYKSTNYGSTWTELKPGGENNFYWSAIDISSDGNHIMVCAYKKDAVNGCAYYSSNGGTDWVNILPVGETGASDVSINSDGSYKMLVAGSKKLYIWR